MKKEEPLFNRTLPILGERGLSVISKASISISGLGGVGGGTFLALVRAGVRRFRLAENGIFDAPDMNRQMGAFGFTLGRPKLDVYVELAKSINPDLELELFPEGISVENLERFLEGSDVYVGVIDYEKGEDVKKMTPKFLKKFHIPLFTCAVIGFGALMINYHPDEMMPDEFWQLAFEKSKDIPFGLLPHKISRCFNSETIKRIEKAFNNNISATTSIGALCSNVLLASEVLIWLLRGMEYVKRGPVFAPYFVALDLMDMSFSIKDIRE